MLTTIISNLLVNLLGLLIVSFFIFRTTLSKYDFFSFLMVIYFCSCFPYLLAKGGGFNMVSFICLGLFFIIKKKFPGEKRISDPWYKIFVFLFVLSCVLGWLINYTGKGLDFFYSFITFTGLILLLLFSSKIELTPIRIAVFLRLNLIIIIYSTVASLNKYLHIITFNTPMMPIYGMEGEYFEGGGVIGSSPLYGEHSLILLILFTVFYIINKHDINIKRPLILLAMLIAFINVFMSVSRSVFLLSVFGMMMVVLLQYKVSSIKTDTILKQIFVILLFSSALFFTIKYTKLDYVFSRLEVIEAETKKTSGMFIEKILDGRAFNRETAFYVAKERFYSKKSWLIGYGWGIGQNNRDAFFVDPSIPRGSAHTQIFAILFLFGWLGFVAYWGIILRIIYKSYLAINRKDIRYLKRMMAYFFMIAFVLFVFNEIKADSVSVPSYFAVTIIWMGLAYSTLPSVRPSSRIWR